MLFMLQCKVNVRNVCGKMCMCVKCFIVYMFDCVRAGFAQAVLYVFVVEV